MTEDFIRRNYELMRAGEWYDANYGDPKLAADRQRAKDMCMQYSTISFKDVDKQRAFIKELFGTVGENVDVMAPMMCDYGYNIHLGDFVFFNHGCYFMDTNDIKIGSRVFVGPNVGFYGAVHPIDAIERAKGLEKALPITIGSDVWIGGNAIFMPGVKVGSNVVIGAGSVVTHDIPDNCVAFGNPCRVRKQLPPLPEKC